jgi:hypothetical protein
MMPDAPDPITQKSWGKTTQAVDPEAQRLYNERMSKYAQSSTTENVVDYNEHMKELKEKESKAGR